MIKQYDLLNSCLRQLKSSKLPALKKLKIELLLIQTKQVLLKSVVESRVTGDAASEREFLGIYDSVRRVCSCYCEAETDLLIGHLEKVKEGLNQNSEAKRTSMWRGQKNSGRGLLNA